MTFKHLDNLTTALKPFMIDSVLGFFLVGGKKGTDRVNMFQ